MCLTFACLFLFFFTCPSSAARVNREGLTLGSSDNYLVSDSNYTKNVGLIENESLYGDQSEVVLRNVENDSPLEEDTSVGKFMGSFIDRFINFKMSKNKMPFFCF